MNKCQSEAPPGRSPLFAKFRRTSRRLTSEASKYRFWGTNQASPVSLHIEKGRRIGVNFTSKRDESPDDLVQCMFFGLHLEDRS